MQPETLAKLVRNPRGEEWNRQRMRLARRSNEQGLLYEEIGTHER